MEYEIEHQGEHALFDDSTNPSLKHDDEEEPMFFRRSGKPAPQRAEPIPEEDEQLS